MGVPARAPLFNSVITSVACWGMETVGTRQKHRGAFVVPDVVVLDEADMSEERKGVGYVLQTVAGHH